MLIRQMKYFIMVVECGSFTAAAEQNNISQSAISQQIQGLERDLGVRLISRGKRNLTLTAAGDYYYCQARQILAAIEILEAETRRLGDIREARADDRN